MSANLRSFVDTGYTRLRLAQSSIAFHLKPQDQSAVDAVDASVATMWSPDPGIIAALASIIPVRVCMRRGMGFVLFMQSRVYTSNGLALKEI